MSHEGREGGLMRLLHAGSGAELHDCMVCAF